MTFTIIYKNILDTVDIETLDELAYVYEDYGYTKMIIDMRNMTITIIDDEN